MRGVARRTWQVARQLSREHLLEHVLPLTKRLAQATQAARGTRFPPLAPVSHPVPCGLAIPRAVFRPSHLTHSN